MQPFLEKAGDSDANVSICDKASQKYKNVKKKHFQRKALTTPSHTRSTLTDA